MGRLVKLSEDTLLRILADFFMPMLVFSSLYLSPISPFEMLTLSGSAVFVIVLTLAAACQEGRRRGLVFTYLQELLCALRSVSFVEYWQ